MTETLPEFRFYYFTSLYQETIGFYRDILQWQIVRSWDRNETDKGTIFLSPNGHGWIEIEHGETVPTIQGGLYIQVNDVDEYYRRLSATTGIDIIDTLSDKSYGHRNFKFKDPSGLTITLFNYLN
jgi:predicted enzyme related to lactoylglutathione lyase